MSGTCSCWDRQNPRPEDALRLAVRLTGEPIQREDGWIHETGGILMADGTGIELEVSRFANPYLEMCRAYIANASTLQAIGGAVRSTGGRDNPVTVWILSKTIVPWPIDDLFRWEGRGPQSDGADGSKGDGNWRALSDAAGFYRDLFSSVTAAQKAYQRARGSRTNCHLATFPG